MQYYYDYQNNQNKGRGKLYLVRIDGVNTERYYYDLFSRPAQHVRYVDGTAYAESYAYNSYGQIATLTYPDGFAVDYTYTGKGYLNEITRHDNGKQIFKAYNYNIFGQPTKYGYGNATATEYEYNTVGLLTRIKTGNKNHNPINPDLPPIIGFEPISEIGSVNTNSVVLDLPDESPFTVDSTIQNFRYGYDNVGRLIQRTQKNSQYETFQYDNLDRLTSFTQGTLNGISQTFSTMYDAQGNILSNTLAGTYSYGSDKPHAVIEVTTNEVFPNAISASDCYTEYNVFNQPSRIAEGDVEILLEYGADNQRVKAVFKRNGHVVRTRYYISANYEKEIDSRGEVFHYHYIYSATGLAAICVRRNGVDSMYYVHPDRLGSYTHITNANKQVIRSLHFDPWGNVKADTNWTVFVEDAPGKLVLSSRFDRGFTGHEHYADLKIINMNGRLYDPVIARFFSPDNFVQAPGFTQSYNRYSYCLNNPLQYVDPSGESIVLAMILGAAANVVFQSLAGNINGNSDLLWSFFVGGLAGLAGGVAGGATAAAVGVGGFLGGAASGAAAGAASCFITGTGNALIAGNDLATSLKCGLMGGAIGALSGALMGGLSRGIMDARHGYNFWDGSGFIEQELGTTVSEDKIPYYQRMAESYNSCSYFSENDEILRNRVCDMFDVDFDWDISSFTTYVDERYGLTENGIYVNLETKGLVKGYVKRFPREVHISYYYTNASDLEFMECVGHELIHAYHLYTIPSYYRPYSERVAYQYSYNVYWRNGYYAKAMRLMYLVSQKGYFGWYPFQYSIPSPFILFH